MIPVLLQQRAQPNVASQSAANSIASKENDMEAQRRQEEMIALLTKIEENTKNALRIKPATKEDSNDKSGLGVLATALAVALGALVGYIKGYVKLLKGILEAITPESWKKAFTEKVEKIAVAIEEFAGKVRKMFSESWAKFKDLFVFDEESKIGRFIKAIKERMSMILEPVQKALVTLEELFVSVKKSIGEFFKPIKSAFTSITDAAVTVKDGTTWFGELATKVKGFFAGVVEWGGKFTKVFKGAMVIFEKLALPLTVIMTLWDTVKGAIAGFEKDGIIGGITGAIKGFFNSLIFGPVDMLKDAIAWVLGFFGFDKAKKALESFSFEKIFDSMVDTIADVLKGAFKWISDLWTNFSWDETWGKITAFVTDAFNAAPEAVKKLTDKVTDLWTNFSWDETWGKIVGFVTDALTAAPTAFITLKDKIIDLWNNFSFDGVLEQVSKSISDITESIKNWFKDKLKKLTDVFGSDDKPAASAAAPATAKVDDGKKGWYNPTGWFSSDEKAAQPAAKAIAPSAVITPSPISSAKTVNASSADADAAKQNAMKPVSAGNTVVSAPTTNNVSKTTQVVQLPVRNQDQTMSRYLRTRFAIA